MGQLIRCGLLGLILLCALSVHHVHSEDKNIPSEAECRPYIEKALNTLNEEQPENEAVNGLGTTASSNENYDDDDNASKEVPAPDGDDDNDNEPADGVVTDDVSTEQKDDADSAENKEDAAADDDDNDSESGEKNDDKDDEKDGEQEDEADDDNSAENGTEADGGAADDDNSAEEQNDASEVANEEEDEVKADEADDDDSNEKEEAAEDDSEGDSTEQTDKDESGEVVVDGNDADDDSKEQADDDSKEQADEATDDDSKEQADEAADDDDKDDDKDDGNDENDSKEQSDDDNSGEAVEEEVVKAEEAAQNDAAAPSDDDDSQEDSDDNTAEDNDNKSDEADDDKDQKNDDNSEEKTEAADGNDDDSQENEAADKKDDDDTEEGDDNKNDAEAADDDDDDDDNSESKSYPEEDLLLEFQIPKNRRDRDHIDELLHLDDDSDEQENALNKAADVVLKDLKRIYENAIKPLETLYKYRDLSNRHFGDPEIFSKPLLLLMGPWSGGKSTILNYLTDNEYTENSIRTGAEPSPAYFNILMHGDQPEVLDGTQLAADWTFSGLQKFGQGLGDRLRGLRLPNKLLEKINIVEIPGILEVRKQVSRHFPFNDACQWFIDRADIIFLVYDPSKLDVGPETEAILDQLKGREYQTRIVLNKADIVKAEELLRVQSALIWNISPLMSSAQPPVMYTTSLWSHPYEAGAPVRLLQAQERALLRDLRQAVDHRIENKIASARRFAVRVRNHAKMVDCYLTTYYNHKTLFGNKKKVSTEIIEHPQNYHIYEGLSTLTNISRYDLPDPDVYRDFFRLNPLYEFKKLSETCTYFRGCPINKLDVSIAYDLPELVGKYKKQVQATLSKFEQEANSPKGSR